MTNRIRFTVGVGTGVALTIIVPWLVLASGRMDMSATARPGWVERTLAPWAVDRSRAHRAPEVRNPSTGSATAVATGLAHYRENCVMCHGAPGVAGGELARGLNPPAPALQDPNSQDLTDGELFWTIKHGVRMSGMPAFGPAHSDDEIWALVAFVRHG